MNRWLVKTGPGHLSYDDLAAGRARTYGGVRAPAALSHLGAMRRGDEVLVYHLGRERAIVGIARVRRGPHGDPDDPRAVVLDLRPVRRLERPLPLAELRRVPALAGWALLETPRLTVMPTPAGVWRRVLALARRPPP